MTVQERTYCGQPGDYMTVRHLTIHGSNVEIGRALGELAIKRDGRTPAHFAAGCDTVVRHELEYARSCFGEWNQRHAGDDSCWSTILSA